MSRILSQGALAWHNGQKVHEYVRSLLGMKGYRRSPERSIVSLLDDGHCLFAEPGRFAEKCQVPLVAPYHTRGKYAAEVDFVIIPRPGQPVLLSIKSQLSNGTAEEKLEYEIRQLHSTELPSAMFVYGPVRGRDAETGWSGHVLGQIWERSLHDGAGRVLLFRKEDSLSRWIRDGLPVATGGQVNWSVFSQYCDREP